MGLLYVVAVMVSLSFLTLGIFKPEMVLFWMSKEKATLSKVFLIFGTITILLYGVFAYTLEHTNNNKLYEQDYRYADAQLSKGV